MTSYLVSEAGRRLESSVDAQFRVIFRKLGTKFCINLVSYVVLMARAEHLQGWCSLCIILSGLFGASFLARYFWDICSWQSNIISNCFDEKIRYSVLTSDFTFFQVWNESYVILVTPSSTHEVHIG